MERKKITRKIKPRYRLNNVEKNFLILKEWIECSAWLLGQPVLFISYLYLLLYQFNFISVTIMFIPIFLRFYLDMFLLQKSLKYLDDSYVGITIENNERLWDRFIVIMTSPIQGLFRMVSPIKGIYSAFKTYIFKINVERTKTER